VSSPFATAVDGFVDRARHWTDVAGSHARTVASRVDDGSYGADVDALIGDAAKSVALAARGWAQFAGTFLDAAAKIVAPPAVDRLVESDVLKAPGPATRRRALELADDMQSDFGDTLSRALVELHPAELPRGDRHFQLVVHATGLRGVPYFGEVVVREAASGRKVGGVQVSVQVS
jgi:hypothetical protein